MSEECVSLIDEMIELRRAKGWTQKDLSTACGLTQPVIARFESKKSAPTLSTLQRIVDALGARLVLSRREDNG